MFLYHKELTRQIIAVYKSNVEILQMALFILLMTSMFALISVIVIGNVSSPHDELTQDYGNFYYMFISLYGLISFDGYPGIMLPAIQETPYNIIYFVLYISLYMFFFLPVPVATVYEAYRKYRCQI